MWPNRASSRVAIERLAAPARATPDSRIPVTIDVAVSHGLGQTLDLTLSSDGVTMDHATRTIAADIERLSDRTGRIIRETLEAMPLEDRMIVRFHFGESISIADISGLLRLPQRPLYRRLESLLQRFRKALAGAAIDARDVADLIGNATRELDFGLQNGKSDPPRRTNPDETTRVEEAG